MLYVGHELLQRELCLAVAAGEQVSPGNVSPSSCQQCDDIPLKKVAKIPFLKSVF